MKQVFAQSLEDWSSFLESLKEPKYRAKQILEWIYQKKVSSFDAMANIPKHLREKLKQEFCFESLKIQEIQESQKDKGTKKILWQTPDHLFCESVILPNSKSKNTLCLSTQIGCAFVCDFCATGKMGYKRNLTLEEILYPFWIGLKDFAISNVVFMGMGEPLVNPHFWNALEIMLSPDFFHFPDRDITVSTIGIPEGIIRMANYKQVKLAWSYHSSFAEKRKKIFPILSQKYNLLEIQNAFIHYQKLTKKRITIEYLILPGFNDDKKEANELIQLSSKLFFFLNLIPYNPHPLSSYSKPNLESIEKFASYFKNTGIETVIRQSKGQDIQGACGQLAGKQKNN